MKIVGTAGTAPQQSSPRKRLIAAGEHVSLQLYILSGIMLVISILAHLPLLLVGGSIFLLILIITDVWATYCLSEVRYQRHLSEKRVIFGEEITLEISIENAKILPLPVLQIDDTVPRALPIKGQAMRKTLVSNLATLEGLFSLRWYERVTRTYTVQCINRGIFTFGPVKLRSSDIFGFITRELKDPTEHHILVYPLIVPLSSFHLPTQRPFGDHRTSRRLLEDPSRVIGVRDYSYGDSMRRINWKASARALELRSKVYESTTTYTLAIFLNSALQFDNYYSIHPALQELSICAAASISNWAIDEGYAVGLYANTPMSLPDDEDPTETYDQQDLQKTITRQLKRQTIRIPPGSSEGQRQRIMETLARIQAYAGSSLEEVLQAEKSHLPLGATVIAITDRINEHMMETLLRMRRSGHAVTLLLIGDNPPPTRISGITVYYLGGEETWDTLQTTYGHVDTEKQGEKAHIEGFQL
jgi:uncharacterized protein (DUF58 family)